MEDLREISIFDRNYRSQTILEVADAIEQFSFSGKESNNKLFLDFPRDKRITQKNTNQILLEHDET